jgi:Cytochrome c554 and c-prime
MPSGSSRRRFMIGGIATLPSLVLALGAMRSDEIPPSALISSNQQPVPKDRPRGANDGAELPEYLGAAACRNCHSEPHQDETDFVQLTEFTVWKNDDKHSQAYEVLTWERAQRMGRILKIDDVTSSSRCLNCHAINPPQARRSSDFKLSDGVSCEGCHGPAERWGLIHRSKDWRLKDAAEKASYGMVDVRNPSQRTQLCASCHIGNLAEGKVVTHELYAAGHPPLPGFEIASFSDVLPKHWRNRRDVPYLKTAPAAIQARFDFANAPFEQTKLVVLGALVSLREAMTLVANQAALGKDGELAQGERVAPEKPVAWPEYAAFDCEACHHDLRVPSWRQRRGWIGRPGRPLIRAWPLALVRLGIRHVSKDEPAFQANLSEFQGLARRLAVACDARPFGNPGELEAAAAALARWANPIVQQLAAASFDESSALRLLNELCAIATSETFEVETACQLAWAFSVIYSEWSPKHANEPQIRTTLKSLQDQLPLRLNTNREERANVFANTSDPERQRQLESLSNSELADTLRRASSYDPAPFQAAFRELARLLPHL